MKLGLLKNNTGFLKKIKKQDKLRVYILSFVFLLLLTSFMWRYFDFSSVMINKDVLKQREKELVKYKGLIKKSTGSQVSEDVISYLKAPGEASSEMMVFTSDVEKTINRLGISILNIQPSGIVEIDDELSLFLKLECKTTLENIIKLIYNLRHSGKIVKVSAFEIIPDRGTELQFKISLTKNMLR